MNNNEKHDIIAKLPAYWLESHPDCFLEYPDGRKIFREDLLSYKQDMMLRDVYASKPPPAQPADHRPLWACIAILTLIEVVRFVVHI